MPLYEYACASCGVHTEVMQRVGAPPLASCPHCGGPVHKVLAPPALQFKGTGWYITDYARGGNGGKAESRTEQKGSSESTPASSGDTASGNGKKP
jgi:putative FmdB family regulatory protein